MESFKETSEREIPKRPQSSISPSLKLTAKEILVTKAQNYFAQTKTTETFLTQVAFSIGLGSIWRFPYLCHQNGGGDFILTYFLLLLLFGIPLLYLEMVVGQWLKVDNIGLWKQLVPWLGGIGYTSLLVCILVSVYNSVIISWSFSYLANSFHHPLPWDQCPWMKNANVTSLSCLSTVSHQYFWYNTILNASSCIEEGVKSLVPNLTLGIFVAWFLLFITLVVGLKILLPGLIFSVFFPYILLLCLLIRSLFLEGAATSLRRLVTIELSTWASLDLWRQAGGHMLYSLGLGMGTIINISHKAIGDNYVQMAFLVALVTLISSLLTTSIVFIVLGFWGASSGQACVEKSVLKLRDLIDKGMLPQDVRPPEGMLLRPPLDYLLWIENLPAHLKKEVLRFAQPCSIKAQEDKFMQSPGLMFVALSQAVSLFPGASFWAILFFLIPVITGLNTLIKILESIVYSLQNSSSIFRKRPLLLSAVVCLGGFLGSLVFTSHPGSYIMSLFDEYLVPLVLIITVAFQNVTLAWVYGANRFMGEMYGDLGHLLWSFFVFLWYYVTLPGLLALLTVCMVTLYRSTPPYYLAWNGSLGQEVKQAYLPSSLVWVSFLSILTILPIPIYPIQRWWYLQDHVVSDPFEKMQSKKLTLVSIKPSQWPKHHLAKSNLLSQERRSDTSERKPSEPLSQGTDLDSLWEFSWPWSRYSSGFSLPLITSQTSSFSMKSADLASSRQLNPTSETLVNSDIGRDTKEENVGNKSVP